MATFAYTGRDAKGILVQGQHEAVSSDDIASYLFTSGITPLEITEKKELPISELEDRRNTLGVEESKTQLVVRAIKREQRQVGAEDTRINSGVEIKNFIWSGLNASLISRVPPTAISKDAQLGCLDQINKNPTAIG